MIFRLTNSNMPYGRKPHPWADQVGDGWVVEINDPADLLSLVGPTGKLTIYCRPDEPSIEIEEDQIESDRQKAREDIHNLQVVRQFIALGRDEAQS